MYDYICCEAKMFYWNKENIADTIDGFSKGEDWCSKTNKVSIDTRTLNSGDIFVAIKGNNYDGHNYIKDAFSRGAVAAIVNKSFCSDEKLPLFFVEDTLIAMQSMAKHYINNVLKSKIIAITGSVGKTTTKDILTQVFSCYGSTESTTGNLNNDIGMPLCILNVSQSIEFLILEMGMSSCGEIKKLSMIARPHISIITNIEPVHLANFNSVLEIAKAKSEIFYGLRESSYIILNIDNEYYQYLLLISCNFNNINRTISVGSSENADISVSNINISHDGLKFDIKIDGDRFECKMSDRRVHLAYNALFAFAAAYLLQLDLFLIPSALKTFTVSEGRGKISKIIYYNKRITLIDDSYNASPSSVRSAIKSLCSYSNRKVIILGEMLELGDESLRYHIELLDCIYESNIDKVYTVGVNMGELHKRLFSNCRGTHFEDSEQLFVDIKNIIHNDDVILIKGSNSTNLRNVVQRIINNSKEQSY